jgi:hypothetical protein
MTAEGNMKLTPEQKKTLQELEKAQAAARKDNAEKVIEATRKAGYLVTKTDKGYEAPDVV